MLKKWLRTLLPLDCAGRFAGNVVDDAVDAVDFVDDAAGEAFDKSAKIWLFPQGKLRIARGDYFASWSC